jgi:hypothetical protein
MKDEHDLRGARFAGIQTDFANLIEVRTRSHSARANCGRFDSLRFAATGKDQRDRNNRDVFH